MALFRKKLRRVVGAVVEVLDCSEFVGDLLSSLIRILDIVYWNHQNGRSQAPMSRFLPAALSIMKSPAFLTLAIVALIIPACAEASPTKEEPPPKAKKETPPKAAEPPKAISLFDGDELGHWEPIEFANRGGVHVSFDGELTLEAGVPFTGVVWTGAPKKLPTSDYEISLETIMHYGDDFFCALTFPIKRSHATLIVGGWGGVVFGISSIDDEDASLNETSQDIIFKRNQWYNIRLRVTDDHLTGWLDDKEMFKVELADKKISLRPGEIERCVPLGIASFRTRSAFRNITLRHLD